MSFGNYRGWIDKKNIWGIKEKETIHQGKLRMIRYPALFDDEKYINDKPAPKLGEDNEILLK